MEMSFEDIIKFLDSLIVPIIVGILSAGLTIYIKNKLKQKKVKPVDNNQTKTYLCICGL